MKKSILVLSAVLAVACVLMGCKREVVYDDVVAGDGKSPIRLQLKSGKYVTADWQYPKYHKEFTFDNGTKKGVTCYNWIYCDTGKDCEIIFNYNPNNGYYMIGGGKMDRNKYNKDMFRPYTVEEMETLIGIIPPSAVYLCVESDKTNVLIFEKDGTYIMIEDRNNDYNEYEVSRGTYLGDASKDGEITITINKKYVDGSYADYTEDDATHSVTISNGEFKSDKLTPWVISNPLIRQ